MPELTQSKPAAALSQRRTRLPRWISALVNVAAVLILAQLWISLLLPAINEALLALECRLDDARSSYRGIVSVLCARDLSPFDVVVIGDRAFQASIRKEAPAGLQIGEVLTASWAGSSYLDTIVLAQQWLKADLYVAMSTPVSWHAGERMEGRSIRTEQYDWRRRHGAFWRVRQLAGHFWQPLVRQRGWSLPGIEGSAFALQLSLARAELSDLRRHALYLSGSYDLGGHAIPYDRDPDRPALLGDKRLSVGTFGKRGERLLWVHDPAPRDAAGLPGLSAAAWGKLVAEYESRFVSEAQPLPVRGRFVEISEVSGAILGFTE